MGRVGHRRMPAEALPSGRQLASNRPGKAAGSESAPAARKHPQAAPPLGSPTHMADKCCLRRQHGYLREGAHHASTPTNGACACTCACASASACARAPQGACVRAARARIGSGARKCMEACRCRHTCACMAACMCVHVYARASAYACAHMLRLRAQPLASADAHAQARTRTCALAHAPP